MANRERYGINTLWVELLCNNKTACNSDGTTFDGIPPFTVPGDISAPNPAYFQRVDDMLNIAAAHGIMILLDAVETDGWLATFKLNGARESGCLWTISWQSLQRFPEYHLDVRQRFSDVDGSSPTTPSC